MKEDALQMKTYSVVSKVNLFFLKYCLSPELFITACSAAVIPAGPPSTNLTVIATIGSTNVIGLKGAIEITTKFKFNITDQHLNSSFCHITSLEVYRGRKEAIQISHVGFSLSINGTVDVRQYDRCSCRFAR